MEGDNYVNYYNNTLNAGDFHRFFLFSLASLELLTSPVYIVKKIFYIVNGI